MTSHRVSVGSIASARRACVACSSPSRCVHKVMLMY